MRRRVTGAIDRSCRPSPSSSRLAKISRSVRRAMRHPPIAQLERWESPSSERISVIDTGADVFVLVPPSCRAQRRTIAYALDLAEQRSKTARSAGRPFRPPVHALILPSAIPLDLAASLRGSALEALVRRQSRGAS